MRYYKFYETRKWGTYLMIHGATYFTVCWKFITRLSTMLTALGYNDGFYCKDDDVPDVFSRR